MQKFTVHTGVVVPLLRGNIDTDQIISKEFLKSIKRTGFGEALFYHWRFDAKGQPNPDFSFNQPAFKEASILLGGNNFGCGSSREHAVWAIVQYGFRVIIAPAKQEKTTSIPAFADIFKNNSAKNGLLLVELSQEQVDQIAQEIQKTPGLKIEVDLAKQKITLLNEARLSFDFEIEAPTKQKLLEGLDDIGVTEKYFDAITSFEKKHNNQINLEF